MLRCLAHGGYYARSVVSVRSISGLRGVSVADGNDELGAVIYDYMERTANDTTL